MESFKKLLESKKIKISIKHLGIQDGGIFYEIKSIIENIDFFENLYLQNNFNGINNLDDYYFYLFSLKIISMRESIPYLLHEEHKTLVAKLCDDAEKTISVIKAGDVIRFINQNFQSIFHKEKQYDDQWYVTIDIVAKYCQGIKKENLEYLCNNFRYLVVDRFDKFEKILEMYPDLFDSIYSAKNLEEILSYRLEETLDFCSHIVKKEKSSLKETVEKHIAEFSEYFKRMIKTATTENCIQVEITARKFYSFLQQIKSPKANEFEKYSKIVAEICSENLSEHGVFLQNKIDVEDMINTWKNTKDWRTRLLYITHDLKIDKNTPAHVSRLSRKPEGKRNVIDFFGSNIPTDDYYTMSQQLALSSISSIETAIMTEIIRDQDNLSDYFSLVTSATSFISEYLNAEEEELQHDVETMSSQVYMISINLQTENPAMQGVCYGAAMFICAFSEKLLRILYAWLVKDEEYIAINKITLGDLLVKNPKITEVFEENHVANLSFFLLRTGENVVGENIRNSLAHLTNISASDLTPSLVVKTLWIFTDILNTIFWHCFKDLANKIGTSNDPQKYSEGGGK